MEDDFIIEAQKRIAELDADVNQRLAELGLVQRKRSEMQTALKIYCEVTGKTPAPTKMVEAAAVPAQASEPAPAPQRPSAEKKHLIRRLLGFGESTGKTPATVFKQLVQQNVTDIPITQVRTILWRMESKKQGVASKDGRYFLVEQEKPALEIDTTDWMVGPEVR